MRKTQRILELYRRFCTGARLSIKQICDEYNLSRKTAERDLEELGDFGLELLRDDAALEPVYFAHSCSRKIDVSYSLHEVSALFVARRFFDFLENTSLEDAFNRVYSRIESQLRRTGDLEGAKRLLQKVYLVHEGPKKLPARSSAILDDCLTALLYENILTFSYRSASGKVSRVTLKPYTITLYKRGLYLAGVSTENSDRIRIYALERMNRSRWHRGEAFHYPEKWSPDDFFKNAFFIVPGTPEKIKLRFTPATELFIKIRKFHPSQRTRKLDDGTVEMTLKVPCNFELVNWILSFGPHVEVVSPAVLRTQVASQLQAALSQYPLETSKTECDDTSQETAYKDTLSFDLFERLEG